MPRALLLAAQDADEVSAGLQLFLDHIPQRETDLEGCIKELLVLATAIRDLQDQFPDYETVSQRLTADVELCLRSLALTLRSVRDMFAETRHVKYSGERPYRRCWDEMCHLFTAKERGPSLLSRLETYDIFIQNILDLLRGEYVDADAIKRDRQRVASLLERQKPIEQTFTGLSFTDPLGIYGFHATKRRPPKADAHSDRPPRRPPLHHLNTFPFPFPSPTSTMSPPWSDGSDSGILPPVPEPPSPWSPQSPTISNTSNGTWNSNSSAPRAPINHWATKVFTGQHGHTHLRALGDPIACHGRAEHPGCTARLAAENFLEVLRLPMDAANFYVRIYWRPVDHRARILCSRKDGSGLMTHYCIPLTALKLVRKGSTLTLWRYDRDYADLTLWASLSFSFYEPLVLFYCAFTAMKSQDYQKYPEILQDRFHKRERSDEKEEFSGEIKDDNFLHALRLYRDKDSGGIRLEARPRRGPMTSTPIWMAFISHLIIKKSWIRVVSTKTLQLSELHPYIFTPNYTPPRSKSGKVRLQFTSAKDAASFMEMVNTLAT